MKRVTEASFARWAAFLLLLTAGCSSEYAADEYAVGTAEAPGMFQDSVDAELADATDEEAAGSEAVPSPDAALETDRQLIYVADVRLVVNDFAAV